MWMLNYAAAFHDKEMHEFQKNSSNKKKNWHDIKRYNRKLKWSRLPNWYLLEYSLSQLAKSYIMYQICTFYNTSSTPWKGWPEVEWLQWRTDPQRLCSSWGWSRRRSGNHHSPSPQRQHPSLSFSNGFWCKSVLLFRVSRPARASQVGAHLYSHCYLSASA